MSATYQTLLEITDKIHHELHNDIATNTEQDTAIAYLNALILTKLNKSCDLIGKQLVMNELEYNGNIDRNNHLRVNDRLNRLITEINYQLFENNLILENERKEQLQQQESLLLETNGGDADTTTRTTEGELERRQSSSAGVGGGSQDEENVSELRKRLLTTSLNDEQQEELYEHHENIQEEIMHDISNLVSYIKKSTTQFQNLIESDNDILSKTEENLSKTTSMFNLNLEKLSQFHKSGKLSYWELIKLFILFLLVIVVTLFIISIF